ncbi:ATP-binding protein [Brucella pseudogrignonensis]|uniref:ATP-binding protein n=1 Tax=Brucella pseudogrignonensis TaxID=419475 RepID=UPI0028B3EFD1|nr:ATP-binding protein [Brucella pseudogrignonensis]MDT6940665.1 ATP-binding protein [Brucella pseudogrignonensis]
MTTENILSQKLDRLIAALERIAPPQPATPDFESANCFVWAPERLTLDAVKRVNRVDIGLIRGVDLVRDQLVDNTRRFAKGYPANNVLLWGARGMGKSSLVKAAQASVNAEQADKLPLKLVEIHREDIDSLPALMKLIKETPYRFILFCDDLSFDHDDTSYKSLKAALEGGVEGRPDNVVFYATSNRRHLMPRDMIDNERSTAVNPSEAIEEKVSLSDRFGLWLGFHKCNQEDYLAMVDGYAANYQLDYDPKLLHAEALTWSTTRGNRSGRVAWQYIQDLAGRLGKAI